MNNILIYTLENKIYETAYNIFYELFGSSTYNTAHAKIFNGTVVLIMRNALFLDTTNVEKFNYFEVYKHRKNNGLKSKIIIDYSLEGHCYFTQIEQLNLITAFKNYDIDVDKDVLFMHNDSTKSLPITETIGNNITIKYAALEAYSKCFLLSGQITDNTPVKDRNNGLNLLIGKFKKPSRFLAAYYFYKYDLLDSSVLGLHALPEDILEMMKKYPEYDDMNFYNKIITCLGPADSCVEIHNTGDGITANHGGWPFDPNIFKNSSVSYISETCDADRANFNLLVTEKTYRSIINKHPFIMQGCSGQLNTIKSLGFETFSSIIDESYNEYDLFDNNDLSHIEKTVLAAKDFVSKVPNNIDRIQEIVDYNYNHWFKTAKNEFDGTYYYLTNFINNI